MHVAVDVGALGAGDGIARYVERSIVTIDRESGGDVRWSLYGRSRARELAMQLRHAHARSDVWPVRAGRALGAFTSLPWWIARDRPDVFWGPAHRLPWPMPRNVARVVTVHDLCWRRFPQTMHPVTRRMDAALMPIALRGADAVVAVSDATRHDLEVYFPDCAGRLRVASPPRTPLPLPEPREALHALGVTGPYALFVGTIEPRKNLRRLLQAFPLVTGSPHRQLVITGPQGWGDEGLATLLRASGLGERVVATGRVDEATLSTLYRHARMLAMPSLYEGFGLPLLEAMSAGTPVVTSNVASMPEVAGDAAVLVEPDRPDSIADAMRRVFDDDALHARLSRLALARAATFTDAAAAEALLGAFESALRRRRDGVQ